MKTWNILPVLALFFMALIPSSFAADLPTKVDRPVIKVGDTWTYHQISRNKYGYSHLQGRQSATRGRV